MGFRCAAQDVGYHLHKRLVRSSEIAREIVNEGSIERSRTGSRTGSRTICMASAESGVEIKAQIIRVRCDFGMLSRQSRRRNRVLMARGRRRIENQRAAVAITRKIPAGVDRVIACQFD